MGLCRSKDHNKDVALGGMNEGNVQRFKHSTLSLLDLSLIVLFYSMACSLWSVWSPTQNTPRHCHKDTCQGTWEQEWCGKRGFTKKGYCLEYIWVCVMSKGCSKCVRKRRRGAIGALQRWWHKQGCRTAWNGAFGGHCWVTFGAGHSNSASYSGFLVCETSIFHINS